MHTHEHMNVQGVSCIIIPFTRLSYLDSSHPPIRACPSCTGPKLLWQWSLIWWRCCLTTFCRCIVGKTSTCWGSNLFCSLGKGCVSSCYCTPEKGVTNNSISVNNVTKDSRPETSRFSARCYNCYRLEQLQREILIQTSQRYILRHFAVHSHQKTAYWHQTSDTT